MGVRGTGQSWDPRRVGRAPLWLALLLVGFSLLASTATGQARGESVLVLPTRGVVNPVLASYITRGIDLARMREAEALVVELDTPGGLESSMREVIQATLASEVPVVFYVYPPGGRAASAGLFLTMAGHVAAMAPSTNIGSAHPVSGEGQPLDETMSAKVTNDAVALIRGLAERRGRNADWAERAVRESVNVSAEEALQLKVVDLVAPDLQTLLRDIDGREVQLASGPRVLRTAGKPVETVEMGFLERLLHLLSDPTIAYILMTVGVYGLIYELASPGAILPGVAGVLALVLALYSLGTLPVNYAALVLIGFGFILMIADVTLTPGVGALAAGGLLSLLIGSLLLLYSLPPYLTLSPFAVAGVVGTTAAFFLIVIRGVVRVSRRPPVMGGSAMVGQRGVARSEVQTSGGMVFVGGELWRARASSGQIASGDAIEVVGLDGLTLVVRKAA
jgi:membrane-bound serine protease (ClpP class)